MGRSNLSYVFFENTIYIQTPLNSLSDKAAIFFEFRHFKAKKNKVRAGRCWALPQACATLCWLSSSGLRVRGKDTLKLALR